MFQNAQNAKTEAEGSILGYVTKADDEVCAEQMSQVTQQSAYYDGPPLLVDAECYTISLEYYTASTLGFE